MTTNAEQAFSKFWQVTALYWTILGATRGPEILMVALGTTPATSSTTSWTINCTFANFWAHLSVRLHAVMFLFSHLTYKLITHRSTR